MSVGERKYGPDDPNVCHSYRDFLPLDLSRVNHVGPTLVDLRRTVRAGCLKCQLLLGGVSKFRHFWEGPAVEYHSQGAVDRWEEAEIKVFISAYEDDALEVVLIRPRREEKSYDNLELEFYSHRGEFQKVWNDSWRAHT